MFAERTNWNLTPNRLSEALAQHLAGGKRLYDLSASNPTEVGFSYDHETILRALCDPNALTYVPDPKGLVRARQGVAEYYADRGNEVSVEDIILTASTSEAYSFVFRALCNPGDELLVPAPSYPLFGFLAGIHDVTLAHYPLVYDHGGIIVVNPNNPTGHFVKPEELAALNAICSARDMALIADEVFLDFAHVDFNGRRELGKVRPRAANGGRPQSLAVNSGALTFTMSGLSKIAGLPQMKAAWLVASGPEPLKKQAVERIEVIADTYLSMNAPIQLALPIFLEQRHGFQKQVLTRVRRNVGELDRQLMLRKMCSRLEIEGGWYAVVRVPATRSDDDLAVDLLTKKGIYVHPGHFYDFATDGYLIVSLIMPERDFAEGCRQMLSMF
jgi:alanine-synthesizing transaminase